MDGFYGLLSRGFSFFVGRGEVPSLEGRRAIKTINRLRGKNTLECDELKNVIDTSPNTRKRNSPSEQTSQRVAGQFNNENYSGR